MNSTYTWLENLNTLIPDITPDSIISRTIYGDEHLKAILFGFDAGQELSEHTASQSAIIHILNGEAAITLDGDRYEAQAGAWIHMPPQLRHSIQAKTPLIMLLLMMK